MAAVKSDSPAAESIGSSDIEDYPLGSAAADDDSLDAYGEEDIIDNGLEPKSDPDNGNDDYARTFDSPAQDGVQELAEAQQHVPEAPESMNSPPASATMPDQSPVALSSADISSASLSTPEHPFQAAQIAAPPLNEQQALDSSESEPALSAPGPSPSPVQTAQTTALDEPHKPVSAQADAGQTPESSDADPDAIDIQKLVDDITAKATATSPSAEEPSIHAPSPVTSQAPPTAAGFAHSSLPPKPSLPEPARHAQFNAETFQPSHFTSHNVDAPVAPPEGPPAPMPMPMPMELSSTYVAAGAPGTTLDAVQNLPPPPSAAFSPAQPSGLFSPTQALPSTAPYTHRDFQTYDAQQAFDQFLADERRYMHEAKWERFPEGSRIFIGNLSQEKVSKRDVFDLFHRYGRLAQISLKSAYGFVQYHAVGEAQAAMQNLEGAEVKGRKIHLEISRTQKKDKDRDRSPDRNKNRGGGGARGGSDRYDGRDSGRRRDDYRPGSGREPSPRRDDRRHRDDTYGRDRDQYDSAQRSRDRSRSPNRLSNPYRSRRSPSPPYGRSRPASQSFDIPRRYGNDVPDIQLLVPHDLERDFISWVEKGFKDQGLRTDVMYLNPRSIPREAIIQRQVLEGVHAVSDLDLRAQTIGKISLQVFDRSGGTNNVRWDNYQDLDPPIAADVVRRAKAAASQPAYPPANYYGQAYSPAPAPAPHGYALPQPQPHIGIPPQHQHQQSVPAAMPDISSLVKQVDNDYLRELLGSLQGSQQASTAPHPGPPAMVAAAAPYPQPGQPAGAAPQIDINALLGNLRNAAANGATAPTGTAPYGSPAYPGPGPGGYGHSPTTAGVPQQGAPVDAAQTVQTIMAQLARQRQ